MLLLLVCDKLTTSEDGATQLLVCGALSPANVICQFSTYKGKTFIFHPKTRQHFQNSFLKIFNLDKRTFKKYHIYFKALE